MTHVEVETNLALRAAQPMLLFAKLIPRPLARKRFSQQPVPVLNGSGGTPEAKSQASGRTRSCCSTSVGEDKARSPTIHSSIWAMTRASTTICSRWHRNRT